MNPFQKGWIWFWYNDITRWVVVMFGLHLIPTIFVCLYFELGEISRTILAVQYMLVFWWAVIDNNYSNLRKIGLDEYRKPLKEKQ